MLFCSLKKKLKTKEYSEYCVHPVLLVLISNNNCFLKKRSYSWTHAFCPSGKTFECEERSCSLCLAWPIFVKDVGEGEGGGGGRVQKRGVAMWGCQSWGQWVIRCGNKKKMGHAVYFLSWRLHPLNPILYGDPTDCSNSNRYGDSMWNVHA